MLKRKFNLLFTKFKVTAVAALIACSMVITSGLSLAVSADDTDAEQPETARNEAYSDDFLDVFTKEDKEALLSSSFFADYEPGVVLDASYIEAPESDGSTDISYSVNADITGIREFITNCYRIALDREPDAESLEGWCNQLVNREAFGVSVVFGFVYSAEFQNAGYDNATYVDKMYNLLLGRAPDEAGRAYWCDLLDKGASRDNIISGFANSLEFFNLCDSYGIYAGYYIPSGGMERNVNINGFVNRLYRICLGRDGDMGGHASWVIALASGQMTGTEAAHGFIYSSEFINKNLSDFDFVSYLYKAFFDRTGDDSEIGEWSFNISKGYMTRERVFDGFANSVEFTNLCDSYGIVRGYSSYGSVYSNGRSHGLLTDFSYLYELEDIIGDKYGITLYIGDEVPKYILNDGQMSPCYDYNEVYASLICLDEYFSYYPNGFFRQLCYNQMETVEIYLAGTSYIDILGYTYVSDFDTSRVMCYDVRAVCEDCLTVTHEISHCTDQAVAYKARFNSSIDFSEAKWNSFNPEGFEYDGTYDSDWGYGDYERDYFISNYSTTYSTEDRAELMSYSIYAYTLGMKLNLPNPIYNKMVYYYTAIRQAFNTNGWPSATSWEMYTVA